jgi:chromosome segregation protein
LRQYQLKRHEAESKLDTTKINLEKVAALIEELLPHLKMLRRQAGKWEKHAELANELKDYEKSYFSNRLAELARELEKIDPETARIEGQIAEKNGELSQRQNDLSAIEKRQPQGDAHFNDFKKQQTQLLNRRSQIQKELGRLEAELEFLLSRPKASVKEAELLTIVKETKRIITEALAHDDVVKIKLALKQLEEKIEQVLDAGSSEVASRQKEISKLKDQFVAELEALEKNLASLGDMENKLAGEMREFNVLFKKAFEALEAKKNEIQALENQKSRLGFDKERVELRRKDLASQAEQWGRTIGEFPAASSGDVDIITVEKKLLRLRGELASIGEIDQALLNEAKEMEVRYTFLSTQMADLEKASQDLKGLITELTEKIHNEFSKALHLVNDEFNNYFRLMFNGGKAKLHLVKKEKPTPELGEDGLPLEELAPQEEEGFDEGGLEVDISIPRKSIKGMDMLSGGERSLVSIAVLFALISVSPPPFLVLDEVDAALDENNTKRFANLIKSFSGKTQFLLVTHNRATMGAANILYGVTMGSDGTSRVLSLKIDDVDSNLIPEKP